MLEPDPLIVGSPAPGFSLPATAGQVVSLSDFSGERWVVLYFYPADDTPGCTKEACGFRDLSARFEAVGATILGVSGDSVESHQQFSSKFGLPFPLLADAGNALATSYGVYGLKKLYGKDVVGITRSTFVIDPAGVIRKIYKKVLVEQHAEEVLNFIGSQQK
jgi:peroxiredoxin Q/BCP